MDESASQNSCICCVDRAGRIRASCYPARCGFARRAKCGEIGRANTRLSFAGSGWRAAANAGSGIVRKSRRTKCVHACGQGEARPLSAALLLPLRSQHRSWEFARLLRRQARFRLRRLYSRRYLFVRANAKKENACADSSRDRARGMAASGSIQIPNSTVQTVISAFPQRVKFSFLVRTPLFP